MIELSSGEVIVTSSVPAFDEVELPALTFTLVDPSIFALSKSETTTLNVPSFVKESPLEKVFFPESPATKVYPSAYANGWAAKWYKSHGGGWKKSGDSE
jgi:hypothetical protein